MTISTHTIKVFYRGQQKLLNTFFLWPASQVSRYRWLRFAYSMNFYHVMGFWCFLFDLLLFLHIILNISRMDEVMRGFFLLATCISYTFKILSTKWNNMEILQLFQRLHQDEEMNGEYNAEEQKILISASQLSWKLRNYYAGISLTALTMVLFSQYCIDPTTLPLPTYNPIDVSDATSCRYWMMYVYQCIALTFACICNISIDSLYCSLFIYAKGQVDILALRLQKIGANEKEPIDTQLKRTIKYYMNIVDLCRTIETLVCKPISVQIFCSVLVLTANFYAMSLLSDDGLVFVKFFIYQSCMLVQIFMLCFYAGEITERSLELEIYKSNWIHWQQADRRLMLLFMQRLTQAIRIRTINPISNCNMDMDNHKSETESFYKYQIYYFKFLGLWRISGKTRPKDLHFVLYFLLVFVMLILFALQVITNLSDIQEILKVFFMFATELACMAKLLHLRFREGQLKDLPILMESKDFVPQTEEEQRIKAKFRSSAVKLRDYYGLASVVAANLILFACLLDEIELPLSMYEPCSVEKLSCFVAFYVYQVVSLELTCWLNIAFDSMVYALLCYVQGELEILVLRLESLGEADTSSEQRFIAHRIRDCCIYYNKIIRLKDLVELLIKLPGSVQLLCSILVLVSNLYSLSSMSVAAGQAPLMIKTVIYQLVMLLQNFMVCYAAHEVTLQSSRLSSALYNSQWITWNRPNRQMACLLMLRFNTPLSIRTLNPTFTFSLTAFGSIINCSYSYYALLKRVNS